MSRFWAGLKSGQGVAGFCLPQGNPLQLSQTIGDLPHSLRRCYLGVCIAQGRQSLRVQAGNAKLNLTNSLAYMPSLKIIKYPFRRKSTAQMQPGQFWAVPLSDGRFACGYVVHKIPGRRAMFVAGLTNWVGDSWPTAEVLWGCKVIEQAKAHLKVVTEHSPEILGCCDPLLEVLPSNRECTWGYNVIRVLAEKHLRNGTPTIRSN